MNELRPCISQLGLPTGAALRQGYALHISAVAASQASMHLTTAKMFKFRLNASMVVAGGNKCAKGARAASVAGHSSRPAHLQRSCSGLS